MVRIIMPPPPPLPHSQNEFLGFQRPQRRSFSRPLYIYKHLSVAVTRPIGFKGVVKENFEGDNLLWANGLRACIY